MTIQGAVKELLEMLEDKTFPIYYKPIIQKIIETIEQEFNDGR